MLLAVWPVEESGHGRYHAHEAPSPSLAGPEPDLLGACSRSVPHHLSRRLGFRVQDPLQGPGALPSTLRKQAWCSVAKTTLAKWPLLSNQSPSPVLSLVSSASTHGTGSWGQSLRTTLRPFAVTDNPPKKKYLTTRKKDKRKHTDGMQREDDTLVCCLPVGTGALRCLHRLPTRGLNAASHCSLNTVSSASALGSPTCHFIPFKTMC